MTTRGLMIFTLCFLTIQLIAFVLWPVPSWSARPDVEVWKLQPEPVRYIVHCPPLIED